jgi:hypothetical protein
VTNLPRALEAGWTPLPFEGSNADRLLPLGATANAEKVFVQRVEILMLVVSPLVCFRGHARLGDHHDDRVCLVRDTLPFGHLEREEVVRPDQPLNLGPLPSGQLDRVAVLPQPRLPGGRWANQLDDRWLVLDGPDGVAAEQALYVVEDKRPERNRRARSPPVAVAAGEQRKGE